MSNQVISQIYNTRDCTEDFAVTDVPTLIRRLNSMDGFVCMQAREVLGCLGKPVIPQLIAALDNAGTQQRWQIIKVLESLNDPTTIPVLVEQLKNEHAGVRWAASNALIGFERKAVPALLLGIMRNYDSTWYRQSAHHILHVLKDEGLLYEAEQQVFAALEGVEPTSAVPWAAEKALESLRIRK